MIPTLFNFFIVRFFKILKCVLLHTKTNRWGDCLTCDVSDNEKLGMTMLIISSILITIVITVIYLASVSGGLL